MGSAMVRGVQRHNVIACVKHSAFNSMEIARYKVDVQAAARAGLDIEMCDTKHYGEKLAAAVRGGLVPMADIGESALKIVRTLLAFAGTEDPRDYPKSLIACEEHERLALEAARKSMTLLKNSGGVLPFSKEGVRKLAVIGRLARVENTGDYGSSRVFPLAA